MGLSWPIAVEGCSCVGDGCLVIYDTYNDPTKLQTFTHCIHFHINFLCELETVIKGQLSKVSNEIYENSLAS